MAVVRAAGAAGRGFVWHLCARKDTSESPTACQLTQRRWPHPASLPATAEDSTWHTGEKKRRHENESESKVEVIKRRESIDW